MKKYFLLLALSIIFIHCGPASEVTKDSYTIKETLDSFTEELLDGDIIGPVPRSVKLRELQINEEEKEITLIYNKDLSFVPFRKENVEKIYKNLFERIPHGYNISVLTINQPIENLIPNYYRNENQIDKSRISSRRNHLPIVRTKNNFDEFKGEPLFNNGLGGKNIVLWHSHGWYYSNSEKRWEWQRPRLFQTVEDLIPLSITVPYLIPMLENAGANVFVPRERDYQANEVIVDNTDRTYIETLLSPGAETGFGPEGYGHMPLPLSSGQNPFQHGNSRYLMSDSVQSSYAEYIPEIPETGEYAVYISYVSNEKSVQDANYTVHYYGGSKEFIVNQTVGGGTWIYLGTFKFLSGLNSAQGRVVVSNKSNSPGKYVSLDAVRFGGGMGIVERGGTTSGRRKFFEGARYWLQFAGMPDTLVYRLNKDTLDYNDDYQSRGEYANYLKGAPYGPNRMKDVKGLGIDIDISLAFHTDAGITDNDTTIGTLAIYSLQGADSLNVYPDSSSRLSSRDVSDIIQTQIVDDLKKLYDPAWSRRQLMESQYSEAFRPNMPAMLLELLSHQNFLDMKFMLDPRFRFDAARAIYKGMLRFLSSQYDFDYVVQPLPVKYFSSEFRGSNTVFLKWKAQADTLEPTAIPTHYMLYTRNSDEGFDSGELVFADSAVKTLQPGKVYSFKVTALNSGGESFPSEILAAGIAEASKGEILIVNGFDRVSGPASVNEGTFAGFTNDIDAGVPDKYDLGFTGRQYDYFKGSKFISNDAPGHGSSTAEYETTIITGNTFDYPYVHGEAVINNGYSFVSMSDEAFGKGEWKQDYSMIDYILGEEKETPWPKPVMDSLRGKQFKAFTPDVINTLTVYLKNGGSLFISGAYLGSELYSDSITAIFAKDILKLKHVTTHASRTGSVEVLHSLSGLKNQSSVFYFNTNKINPAENIYAVTAPGSISHTGAGDVLMRYTDNQFSAAAGYRKDYKIAALGFPFETILNKEVRTDIMGQILQYLGL